MELYLLRHGIAEERDIEKWPDDALRPLTAKGTKRMRQIARGALALGFSFDAMYHSPLVRAKQTASIVADVFNVREILFETDALAPGGNPEKLIELIAGSSNNFKSVLLVGHEPHLSDLISKLVAGDAYAAVVMKKGGFCRLKVPSLRFGKCASIELLLPPAVSMMVKP